MVCLPVRLDLGPSSELLSPSVNDSECAADIRAEGARVRQCAVAAEGIPGADTPAVVRDAIRACRAGAAGAHKACGLTSLGQRKTLSCVPTAVAVRWVGVLVGIVDRVEKLSPAPGRE